MTAAERFGLAGPLLAVTVEGAATLYRCGQALPLKTGEVFTFRRLDLVVAPANADLTLSESATGLTVKVPKGQAAGARDLDRWLNPADHAKVVEWIHAAMETNDRSAMEKLEWTLPLTAGAIWAELERADAGPHAPALRMLLETFDD